MAEKKGEKVKKENDILSELLAAVLQGSDRGGERVPEAAAERVFELADSHAVLPFAAEKFFGHPLLGERAREVCRQTALRNYHLLFLTKYVVGVLGENDIETVVLKGVSVAYYYREPELRKSGDVDLQLLDPSQLHQAEKVLQQKGFHTNAEQHANHHLSMFSPDGIEVELHIMLAEPFDDGEINLYLKQMVQELGRLTQRREIMGVVLPVLSDGPQAFYLLIHMLQHFLRAGFGIRLLCDWVVFWNGDVDEKQRILYRKMTTETGLEQFSRMVTSVCVYYLGLRRKQAGYLCKELFSKEDAASFWKDILDAEEFGRGDRNRMVLLKQRGLKGYAREFHYQMRLNFPRAGKCFLLFPLLWAVTLARFLRNNRKVRGVSMGQVLRTADKRSRRMEQLGLFQNEIEKKN